MNVCVNPEKVVSLGLKATGPVEMIFKRFEEYYIISENDHHLLNPIEKPDLDEELYFELPGSHIKVYFTNLKLKINNQEVLPSELNVTGSIIIEKFGEYFTVPEKDHHLLNPIEKPDLSEALCFELPDSTVKVYLLNLKLETEKQI